MADPLMPPRPAEVPQPLADAWIALILYCESIGLHDSIAALVPHFATSLADKLRSAELKHGYADEWKTLDWQADCQAQLLQHVAKGDPLDVAAFAAFCWARKWRTGQASDHLPAKILDLPLDRLREEVWAWRQDAAARIRGMMASANASDERGEEDRATDIRVNFLSPSAAALSSYIAGEFHEGCEECSMPLLHGQQVWPVEDANDVHVSCWPGPLVQDGVEIKPYTYSDFDTPESVAAIAAEALRYCHGVLEESDPDEAGEPQPKEA